MTKSIMHPVGRRKLAESMGLKPERTISVYIAVPESIHKQWKSRAKAQKVSLSELIRRAMEGK